MRSKLRIDFIDGTTDEVDYVDSTAIRDGVLYAYEPAGSLTFERKIIGAWPLVNIKRWTRT